MTIVTGKHLWQVYYFNTEQRKLNLLETWLAFKILLNTPRQEDHPPFLQTAE